ncbi:RsiV family protein [Porphyromonas gulae]|uniref:DUF3298 domain-containing protein n=1 Tax=Porphyromonas gulae TaxID=111105 RepID=A0A0A2F610_9PORP|nr:RsiV family protein [Porphyromonas gulae]KGN86446.1 hypothetical protein HR08_03790 [Porphyromonas gulae]
MKAKMPLLLLAAFALLLQISSCKKERNKQSDRIVFDSISMERCTHLLGDSTMPCNDIKILFEYPSDSIPHAIGDSVRWNILNALFGPAYASMSPSEAMSAYAAASDSTYLSDMEPLLQEELALKPDYRPDLGLYAYIDHITGKVVFRQDSLLVYEIEAFKYMGGSHGYGDVAYLNLDLRTGKQILLEDIVAQGKDAALTDLLWKQLMADQGVSSLESLNEMGYGTLGDLYPTDNFGISERGITFLYNEYEIAPYAMGPIQITLSFDSLAPILKEDSPTVLLSTGKNGSKR